MTEGATSEFLHIHFLLNQQFFRLNPSEYPWVELHICQLFPWVLGVETQTRDEQNQQNQHWVDA